MQQPCSTSAVLSYYLTEFSSDWAKEARMSSQQLQFGKKVIDTKLGSRAAMLTHPFFEVGLEQPVSEHQGACPDGYTRMDR